MDRGVTLAWVTPGLRRLAWLIEVRGLANRSEGFGGRGPVDKGEGFGWARRAQGLSTKVRDLGGQAGPGPVDKSEGFWGNGPRAGRPTLFGKPGYPHIPALYCKR